MGAPAMRRRTRWDRGLAVASAAALGAGLVVACAGPASEPPVAPPTRAAQPAPPGGVPSTRPSPEPGAPPVLEGPFPTSDQLEELGAAPAPEDLFTLKVAAVEEWTLAGPFPERIGVLPHSDSTPFGALLDAFARSRAGLVVPSEGMSCVARELGRFYLAQRAQPTESLRSFIIARCHAGVAHVASGYVSGDVSASESDARVSERWKEAVRQNLSRYSVGGSRTAGIWFGRDGDHAVAMVAFGKRDLHVEPFSPFLAAGSPLEIRGEVLQPLKAIGAAVNRGRFGVGTCELDPQVALPRFHVVCEVDANEPERFASIEFTPPDRLLSETGLLVLSWSGRKTRETWRAPSYTEARPVSDGDDVSGGFVELLNGVRGEAGLPALELDREQSRQAARLAPHFFAGMLGSSPPMVSDLVVLGLMAGWRVDGIVQSGRFTAAWATESTDLGRLVSGALELPGSRETLMSPDIERIAVGPLVAGPAGRRTLAAVVATYRIFSPQAHEQSAREVIDRLTQQRSAVDLPAPERLEEVATLFPQAAAAVQAGEEPGDALRVLLEASARRLRRPVSGWITEVSDLALVEFPEEYVTRPSLGVGVAVSHRKPPGEAWGHWVVMLVVADARDQGV